jgi:hypothetical protein
MRRPANRQSGHSRVRRYVTIPRIIIAPEKIHNAIRSVPITLSPCSLGVPPQKRNSALLYRTYLKWDIGHKQRIRLLYCTSCSFLPLSNLGIERTDTLREERTLLKLRKKVKDLKPGFPVLWKAVLAIDRSSLGWLKWYFAIFTAVWTDYFCHFTGAEGSWTTAAKITWSIHNVSQTAFF